MGGKAGWQGMRSAKTWVGKKLGMETSTRHGWRRRGNKKRPIAITRISRVLRVFSDGPTDRPTDRVAYRVACTRLKRRKPRELVEDMGRRAGGQDNR